MTDEKLLKHHADSLKSFIRDRDPVHLRFFLNAVKKGEIEPMQAEEIAAMAHPRRESIDPAQRNIDSFLSLGSGDHSLMGIRKVEDILNEAWNWSNTMSPMTKAECDESRHFTENAVRDIAKALTGDEILFYTEVSIEDETEEVIFPKQQNMSFEV